MSTPRPTRRDHRRPRTATWLVAASVAGCAAPWESEVDGAHESHVLTPSGLSPTLLAHARVPVADLAGRAVTLPRLREDDQPGGLTASPAAARVATDDRDRVVLSTLLACALRAEQSVVADLGMVGTLTFVGEVGLAPAWTRRPLRPTERRWVSACLLSRLSADALPGAVSDRGPHQALAVLQDEADAWSAEEGALWGDVLDDPADLSPGYACRGAGYRATPVPGGLADRSCAVPDPARPGLTRCGLRDAGDCDAACRTDVDGGFRVGCRGERGEVDEVVTTFVVP